MMSGNPFPQNAWLTYAEATARWGKPTSPKQVEYILATPEALSAHPAVRALVAEAEARGYNNGMLTAISVVAEERNKHNPGPLFEVLNKALGKVDDARFAAIRALTPADALAAVEALRKELNDTQTQLGDWIVRADEANVRAEKAEAELAAAQQREAGLLGLIRWAHETLWELNPDNYDHDEVCKVNDAAVEVILGLAPVIGETHGYSAEWWAERAALSNSGRGE